MDEKCPPLRNPHGGQRAEQREASSVRRPGRPGRACQPGLHARTWLTMFSCGELRAFASRIAAVQMSAPLPFLSSKGKRAELRFGSPCCLETAPVDRVSLEESGTCACISVPAPTVVWGGATSTRSSLLGGGWGRGRTHVRAITPQNAPDFGIGAG